MRFALSSLVIAVCSLGCAQPQEVPEELNGLARFFFDNFKPPEGEDAAQSDAELQDAIAKLHAAVKGDDVTSDEPQLGTLENLTKKETELVGVERDPDEGQGMFVTNVVHCKLAKMEDIIREPDQLKLYPEAYAEYHRDYDEDPPAYLPTWTVTYKSSENALITNQFTATVETGLRIVPETDNAKHGKALVRAGWLPKPAKFENEGSEFTFDFQVETYYERKAGEIVHFYGMWRYMHLGVLGDSYDQAFIDQTEQGMIDWDTKTDELCASD